MIEAVVSSSHSSPAPALSLTRARSAFAGLASLVLASGCVEDAQPQALVSTPVAAVALAAAQAAPIKLDGWCARLEFPTASSSEAKPAGLLACDLDGDGKDELIAATRGPGGVQVWSGLSPALGGCDEPWLLSFGDYPLGPVWFGTTPPGTKRRRALIAVAPRETSAVMVLDIGAAFKARAVNMAPPVLVWRADLKSRPRVLAAGDLGLDGEPELAVVTIDDDLLVLHSEQIDHKIRLSEELATCALFTSDGVGIAIGFQSSRRVTIYKPSHDGLQGLEPTESIQLDGLPRQLEEFDVDGDGDTELVIAGGDHSVWILGMDNGEGPAGWMKSKLVALATSAIPIALEQGDFDGDGVSELVSVTLSGQDYSILSGKGGAFVRRSSEYAGQHSWGCTLGDFNGDAALDLAVSNPDAGRVSVLFGDGHGGLCSAERARAGRAPISIAAGDFDGDGKSEVLGINALEGTLSVFRNHGGKLADGEMLVAAKSANALACADLDGDGHCDAAYLQRNDKDSQLVMLIGDGRGALWERAAVPPITYGSSIGELVFADLDGDGLREAVASDPEGGQVALLHNVHRAGAEPIFDAARRLALSSGPNALALLEAQGDATPEIAVALGGPGARLGIALLRAVRDAQGGLALEEFQYLPTTQYPVSIAAADLDADGLKDLALLVTATGGDSDGYVIPWLQNKDHSWRALPPLRTGQRPYRVAAGDLDGDGRAEILVSAQNSHHVNLWLTRAGEPLRFVRSADLGAGTGPLDLELVDLDGDGQLEVIVANSFSDDLSVIRKR